MATSLLRIAPAGWICLAACTPSVDVGAERALLLQSDRRYVEAANAGDVETLVGLYAEDGTRYSPDGTVGSGPEAMRAFAEGVASTPGFRLVAVGEPVVEVSPGADMAYTLNELDLTTAGPDGELSVQRLRDFHTWRREPDGWRIVVDIWQVLPR